MPLKISVRTAKPGLHEVALEGRLDTDTSTSLENDLEKLIADNPMVIRLEMSKLSYISSMGIRALFKAARALKQKNALLQMVGIQPQIKKVLDIAQALPPQSVFATVKEADDYFDAMQRKVLNPNSDE